MYVDKIRERIPKYLRDRDLKSLDVYKYHGADYTLMERLLNPFWTWFASFFPDWMAPNMITFSGLLLNISAALIVIINDPTLESKAPNWAYLVAAFALITYLNFDCADGKQARRLNASSPLGQLFDHGCDAINEVFIIMVLASACGTGTNFHTSSVLIIQCMAFSLAQVLEYHIDILVVGNKFFGTTESILVVAAVYAIRGLYGVDVLSSPMSSLLPFSFPYDVSVSAFFLQVTNVCMILTVFQLYMYSLIHGSPIPEEERGEKNLSRGDYVQRTIPSFAMSFCSARLMIFTPLFERHPLLLFFYCGFSFSFLSTRVNISHLCRRRLDWRFAGAYPMLVLTLNSYLDIVDQDMLLVGCTITLFIMYSWYVITVIQQIKHHLGIRALHLSNPKSDFIVFYTY